MMLETKLGLFLSMYFVQVINLDKFTETWIGQVYYQLFVTFNRSNGYQLQNNSSRCENYRFNASIKLFLLSSLLANWSRCLSPISEVLRR